VEGDRVRIFSATSLFDPPGEIVGEKELRGVRLLSPVTPGKIVCVGRNYAAHARELGNDVPQEPILFLKPPSAVIAHGQSIELPPESERVDHECELAIVIGRRGRRINAAAWRDHVFGFTCANDVTARDLQKRDVQFTRGKSFDTFAPLGPWIETQLDPADLSLTTRVNGQVRQNGRTSQMMVHPAELIAFISGVMTLEPGDVILTGTPEGVGPLHSGDEVEVEIEGIGILKNDVRA
jgi:2-keto-4-pentenoate hydratase/2-oxohepta-3-ene-1,7-dioic acid hydratase in catechol pathway